MNRKILEVEVRGGVLLQELSQFHKRKLLEAVRRALPAGAVNEPASRRGSGSQWRNAEFGLRN